MSNIRTRGAFASLTSRFAKSKTDKPLHVRPPYNKDESTFHKSCPECELTPCVTICEEDIIKLDKDRIPFLSFEKGGCTFCEECAKACPSEVLVLNQEHQLKAKFSININICLAWNSVICSTCKDACIEDAINFLGVFRPAIDMDKCTSCGFCYSVCPSYAIKYEKIRDKV